MTVQVELILAARKALDTAIVRVKMISSGYVTATDASVVEAHLVAARAALTVALSHDGGLVEKVGAEEFYEVRR